MKCLATLQNDPWPARYILHSSVSEKRISIDEVIREHGILDFYLIFDWENYSISIGQIEDERFWFIDRNNLKGQIFADIHHVDTNEFILRVTHKYNDEAARYLAEAIHLLSIRYFKKSRPSKIKGH